MEKLDKETQTIAVEKVLEEYKKAEEYVKSWNASWYEQLLDARCLQKIDEVDLNDLEEKYGLRYDLNNTFYFGDVPLIKENLVVNNIIIGKKNVNFEFEFGRIDWHAMTSHKSEREFSFKNNGQINFSKKVKKRVTLQNPNQISYNTTFNVLSNDFSIDIELSKIAQDWVKKIIFDHILIDLTDNILTKKFNDIEIIEDLNTGMRYIRILKKYDKLNRQNNSSIDFEATLNPDDSLEMGSIEINTHKNNGKVNGTYRFDVNRKNGIRANFYSRKGVKVDLTTNPMLLGTANNLLLSSSDTQNSGDIIVANFADSTQNAIAKNLSQRTISFDSSDFDMETIKQIDSMIIELLKNIKGELPLPGLVERIDNCLELVNKNHNLDSMQKKLKLDEKN